MASDCPLRSLRPPPTALSNCLWLPSPTASGCPLELRLAALSNCDWLPSRTASGCPLQLRLAALSNCVSNCVGPPSRAQRGAPFGLWRWLQMALQLHQVKMWARLGALSWARLGALSWRNASVIPEWIAANHDTRWKRACSHIHKVRGGDRRRRFVGCGAPTRLRE